MHRSLRHSLKIGFLGAFFTLALCLCVQSIYSQEIVDKTIATVSDGASDPELITYSDLLWQLALEPETPLNPPTSEDLNRALQTLVNLRIFALEAQRLPSAEPNKDEIAKEIKRILDTFRSAAEFEDRLRTVGFNSKDDDNFQRMMKQRVAIEKYIEFRFRSFVIVTLEDEKKYFREVFTPDFRRKSPGSLLPEFDEIKLQINKILTEDKIAQDIETFLDDATRRAEIVYLFKV